MTRLLDRQGRPLRLDPDLDAPLTGPSVLALVGPGAEGCNMWRVWQPFSALQLRGYPADWGHFNDGRLADHWLRYDAVILCRLSWLKAHRDNGERWFDAVRRARKRIWFEVDDDLFTPFTVWQGKLGIAQGQSLEELEAASEASLWTLRRCDGVTVSTQRLATLVGTLTEKPVAVVPNAIDAGWFQAVQKHGRRPWPDHVTVGWSGSNRPDDDLDAMCEAWGRIAKRYPDVRFVVQGHQPPGLFGRVPEGRLKRVPWMEAREYPLGLVGWDIGCAPLADRAFNRCKTPIKVWEYALSGAAVVASPGLYGRVISDRETGFLAATADEWEACLAHLVESEDERRCSAAALKRDVLTKRSLDRNVWRWPLAWRRLAEG